MSLKRKEVTFLTILLLIYAFIFSYFYLSEYKVASVSEEEEVTLKLYPDTIKIDGDLLTFQAENINTKEKSIVKYQLVTDQEKEMFEINWRTVYIQAIIECQESDGIRNLNGFDYDKYLELTNISNQVKINKIIDMTSYKVPWYQINWKLREIRRAAIIHNNSHFSNLTANYMNSLIFGYRDNTPDNALNNWKNLGVAHLFSLSGMHIFFFLSLFDFILLSLSISSEKVFKFNLIFTLILIILTGLGTGMVRAGLQHLIKQMNTRFKYHFSQLDCWSIALLINCLFNPFVLLTVGGQLTYYLTFLIIFLLPIVKRVKTILWQGIIFNLLLSFFSLPLIWYHFYECNLLSFVINLCLGPILFLVIMPGLLITFIMSFVFKGSQFLLIEKTLYIFQLSGIKLNKLTHFKLVTGKLPFWVFVILIFSQLFIIVEWEKRSQLFTKKIFILGSVTLLIPFFKYANPYGTLAFVDIGQGDSIFLQLPFHQGNYLLDTGGSLGFDVEDWKKRSNKRGADYTVIPYLKSMGVKELDSVFISHAHEDHFGDLDRIGDTIKVKSICYGPGSFEQENFRNYLNYSQFKNTRKKTINSKNCWKKQGIELETLYPIEIGDGQNNDSLVMMLTIKDKKILLTGDLEKEGENELMRKSAADLKADILKAGHHGSNTSTQLPFLEIVSPQLAIVSCGQNNRYNHPSRETLENFRRTSTSVYRTDKDGMIYFKWSPFSKKLSEPFVIK